MMESPQVTFRIRKLISARKRGGRAVGAQITAAYDGRVVTRHAEFVNGQLIGFHPDDNVPMLHRKAEKELEDVRIRHRGALELVETCEKILADETLPEAFVRGYIRVQISMRRVPLLTFNPEELEAQTRKLLAEDRDAAVREAEGIQKIVEATETGLATLRREKPLRVLYTRGS